ncbi:MAG: anaerobic ribonucleoside-triphosphate reductase activating protein [Defluviitaleaceae bacterium]|nr:anaerobic ribonucleoside-triphosphate reductase activating protein [Defluviitaleaceae bacterium]
MRLAGFTKESIVDGPGFRNVIFVQGCHAACAHCHNPESWPMDGGKEYTVREIMKLLKKPSPGRKRIRGITFSGGEPFLQAAELVQLATEAKQIGWDICTFTGYTLEELQAQNNAGIDALLNLTDFLVDGRYVHEQREVGLQFRGSNNQRLIDMNETRSTGKVVLYT